MAELKRFENFPLWMAALSNLVALSIYGLGTYILAGFGPWLAFLYLLYCFGLEIRLLQKSCVNCYYYGKVCGFGKGKLCSLFFKKGQPQTFAQAEVSWFELLPDFLVLLLPVAGGIVLLVRNFTWLMVVMLVILLGLCFGGNAVIRGSLACKYCKQRDLGCPAAKLFGMQE